MSPGLPEKLVAASSSWAGGPHLTLAFDASDEQQIESAFTQLDGDPIDIAVMCAGRHRLRPLQMTKACHIHELLQANVLSALLCTRFFIRRANPAGASVVWVASAAAFDRESRRSDLRRRERCSHRGSARCGRRGGAAPDPAERRGAGRGGNTYVRRVAFTPRWR